jgi:hypothetical protein
MMSHETPEELFVGHVDALAAYERVASILERCGPVEVRVSKSQVAFRRRRGFAYLWMPGRWLAHPGAEVVLSIALNRELDSPRFKEIAHPARWVWMHHLEIQSVGDLDVQVEEWLEEAYRRAG